MVARGDVFDLELTLPGAARSGLTHHAFAASSQQHIDTDGITVLISTTTGSQNQVRFPFACYIDAPDIYTHERGRPFQTDRPITPTQLGSLAVADLPQRVGYVAPRLFTGDGCRKGFGANDVFKVHLQLPGRMESLAKIYPIPQDVSREALGKSVPVERLSIWSITGSANPWLIVSNDKSNLLATFVQGLELLPEPPPGVHPPLDPGDTTLGGVPYSLGASLIMIGTGPRDGVTPAILSRRLGTATVSGQQKVNAHLAWMLAL